MSNPLRIALVAEGTTEFEVIQAALQAILSPRSFVLTKLQPEETKPEMGTGWGGKTGRVILNIGSDCCLGIACGTP